MSSSFDPDDLEPAACDRAAGVLLGLAAGDALGAGYEFVPHVADDVEPQMIGGGLGPWAPGEWTDDTQQAICVAEVAATGNFDLHDIGDRLLAWYRSGPKDVGIQTRAVLDGAGRGRELPDAARRYLADHPNGAAGNGSLMRTAPVALAHLGDDAAIAEAARAVSGLTHADPLAVDACVLWCIAIDRAVREARLDGLRDGLALLDPPARREWSALLDEAEAEPPSTFTPNGFVVRALQAAWSAIVHTPVSADEPWRHLTDSLVTAVRVGHDTDTVAAIAGALLGARWGSTAVPMRWRARLHGWPGYRARDLVRLGVHAAQRGLDDDIGWPGAGDLTSFYRVEFQADTLMTPLPDDPGVVLGSGASAADAECDVMVSLCRMGRTTPPGVGEHHELILIDSPDPEDNPNLEFLLRDTAAAIADWRDQDRTVFVHCAAGVSRTSTIAAAYLAHRFDLDGISALHRIADAHALAAPNDGFVDALAELWP